MCMHMCIIVINYSYAMSDFLLQRILLFYVYTLQLLWNLIVII